MTVTKCGTIYAHMRFGPARCEPICSGTHDGRLAWPTQSGFRNCDKGIDTDTSDTFQTHLVLYSMWITNISSLGRLEAELHFSLTLGRESGKATLPLFLVRVLLYITS
jgi:hypothetical protein